MAVVSRNERKKRRCDALARLTSGMGVSEVAETLVRDYGITRRSANLDINWASDQLLKSLDDVETTHMAAWLLSSIQRVAQKSEEAQQYGVTLGCYKLLYEIALKDRMTPTAKRTWKNHRSV